MSSRQAAATRPSLTGPEPPDSAVYDKCELPHRPTAGFRRPRPLPNDPPQSLLETKYPMSEHVIEPSAAQDVPSALRRYGFCVDPDRSEETLVLRLYGELDIATAPMLREALSSAMEARPSRLRLDLSDLTFVDSTGIGAIMSGARRAAMLGCAFVLRSPGPTVLRTLHLIGVDQLIAIDTGHADN